MVERVVVWTGRAVTLESVEGDGEDERGGGVGEGLRLRGIGTERRGPSSESCSVGVSDDGGADTGDEDVELSGEETGEDDGHEGDSCISMG